MILISLNGSIKRPTALQNASSKAKAILSSPAIPLGGVVAAHIIGALLEKDPDCFEGRKVFFTQLGGAVMQSAWIRPAHVLRKRVGLIAHIMKISHGVRFNA